MGPTGPSGPTGIIPAVDLVNELYFAINAGQQGVAWDLITSLAIYITGTGPVGPTGPIGPTGFGGRR